MKRHTLILTSPKLEIPETKIIEFTKELIVSNLLNVDYFGVEIVNIDTQMLDKNNGTTFLTFHFEYPKIEYNTYSEDGIFQFIINILESQKIGEVIIDDKDIDIYIYQN